MYDFCGLANELFEYTRDLRRDFHRHPELGFKEFRTSEIVSRELSKLRFEVSSGIAKTGVIGLLRGKEPGRVLLLRFDMDALPITEDTSVQYASKNPGVMHACGHDGHTAIGLTVAKILSRFRDEMQGSVKFVFQPAEEGLGGAKLMVEEGVLGQPKPNHALAMHLWNEKPVGWMSISPGPIMAASETFRIRIGGKGGHGAKPHQTQDPIIAAAHIISAIQTIVSRNVGALESAVVSVASIHGGETFNVIPQTVELSGTIRTFDKDVRDLVLTRLQDLVSGVALALNCSVDVEIEEVTPALINNPEITADVEKVAIDLFPGNRIVRNHRTMGSEDMAYLMQDIPGCYIFIGSSNPDKGLNAGHHHPQFDFDEDVLPQAVALMSAASMRLLVSN
jgi:amidohydrolase